MSERRLRRAVFGIALVWPALVVCEQATREYVQYHEHELTLSCPAGVEPPAENVTLAVGNVSTTSAARSCLDTAPDADQVPAAELTSGGATLRFGSASEPGTATGLTLLVTCSYDLAAPLLEPATCIGKARWDLAADLVDPDVVDAPLTVVAERRTSGPAPATFGASVRVSCTDPSQAVVVATDGLPNEELRLDDGDVSCQVEVEIDSAASAAGQSVHQVTVLLRASASSACRSDASCAEGDRCSSSSGTCSFGGNGTRCFSPYDAATDSGDCGPAAPFCSPIGVCHDGRDGRLCGWSGGQSDVYCDVAAGYECVGEGMSATCQPAP